MRIDDELSKLGMRVANTNTLITHFTKYLHCGMSIVYFGAFIYFHSNSVVITHYS